MTRLELVTRTPAQGVPASGDRLWGGRFSEASAAALDAVNRSIAIDFRLWPHDIRLSRAWAMGLWSAGVLTQEECRRIESGLDAVSRRLAGGEMPRASDEDVHTMIDRLLQEEVGEVARRLHTGRSRNDQVATGTRMWVMEACQEVDTAVRQLQQVVLDHAEALQDDLMPAYTHLQRAQPVSAAHWLLSHFWPLDRDRKRLEQVARSTATLPLGSGAVAGCAFPVPRVLLQGALGFVQLSPNSIDAVADRDFVAETVFAVSLLATHLSRLAEDLIMFGSSEFGFVKFGDTFTTGSSMMPQKRNPDALEIARGSGGRILGDLVSLLATLKGLPSGYNKDLQDDKRCLFNAVDAILLVLPGVAGALAESSFQRTRMRESISASMMATDVADYLVERGVPFRDAHQAVGSLIRRSEELGCELDALPATEFTAAHSAFGDGVKDALSAGNSVGRRSVEGGTAPVAVARQIQLARASLDPPAEARGNGLSALVG
ncbi:MAG: argininosuccinate lyase [Gemmatimonadota bacterium]